MKVSRKLLLLLPMIVFTALSSCKKDKDQPYPRNVTIEYKATLLSGTPGNIQIFYFNETEGNSVQNDVTLPFTKQISRSVSAGSKAAINVTAMGPGSIKLEVIVDGNVVASKTTTGSNDSGFGDTALYMWE